MKPVACSRSWSGRRAPRGIQLTVQKLTMVDDLRKAAMRERGPVMRRSRSTRSTAGCPKPHLFERVLSVAGEDLEFGFKAHGFIAWADFLLNPRSLRGSDFLMRWSQGVWSEHRMTQAINETGRYFAFTSGTASLT